MPSGERILRDVRIWHFSGSWRTAPWMRFRARDPAGIFAIAHFEWRSALDELLAEPNEELDLLHKTVRALKQRAVERDA